METKPMSPVELEVRKLNDRAGIHDVIGRYFQGLDRADYERVRSCFTDDVLAQYDDRPGVSGIEAMMDSFKTFRRMKDGSMRITTHFMGNLNYMKLEGDVAETETNAIAFLVHNVSPEGPVAMRSLRYLDRLRRVDTGWKIAVRRHTLDWSCQVSADFSLNLARRLVSLPA
jgi:ketosteroid isomerase-like protein